MRARIIFLEGGSELPQLVEGQWKVDGCKLGFKYKDPSKFAIYSWPGRTSRNESKPKTLPSFLSKNPSRSIFRLVTHLENPFTPRLSIPACCRAGLRIGLCSLHEGAQSLGQLQGLLVIREGFGLMTTKPTLTPNTPPFLGLI